MGLLWVGIFSLLLQPCSAAVDAKSVIETAFATGNLELTLASLPERMRFNHLLFPKSQSNQPSSALLPRVILSEGPLRLGFNGDGNSIEMSEFNLTTKRYDFYAIYFEESGPRVIHNPPVCKICHGQNLRPIWPSLLHSPAWEGSIGSTRALRHLPLIADKETLALREFVKVSGQLPRYRMLGLERIAKNTANPTPLFMEYNRYIDRNQFFEEQLASEMKDFFINELDQSELKAELRVPLLTAFQLKPGLALTALEIKLIFGTDETSADAILSDRVLKLLNRYREATQQKIFLRNTFLQIPLALTPAEFEHDAKTPELTTLAAFDILFERMGRSDLWDFLSNGRCQLELAGSFSSDGTLHQIERSLSDQIFKDHMDLLEYVGLKELPEDFYAAAYSADLAVHGCKDVLAPEE